MKAAAVTYVFNEDINLSIWVEHYGRQFGRENLFIIDSGSSLPAPVNLDGINVIRLPNIPFDDKNKSFALSSLQQTLTRYYDFVVVSDCDEILVANPEKYVDLKDYMQKTGVEYATAIGLNVVHALDREAPINYHLPLLSQRHHAIFNSYETKTLISRVPLRWSPGLHYINAPQYFDTDLFNFHLKLFDYETAMKRHQKNQANIWKNEDDITISHHHTSLERFFESTFQPVMNMLAKNIMDKFNFEEKIKSLKENIVQDAEGFFSFNKEEYQFVKIPPIFSHSILFHPDFQKK